MVPFLFVYCYLDPKVDIKTSHLFTYGKCVIVYHVNSVRAVLAALLHYQQSSRENAQPCYGFVCGYSPTIL